MDKAPEFEPSIFSEQMLSIVPIWDGFQKLFYVVL